MADRAKWADFGPLSLDAGQVGRAAPGWPLAAVRVGHPIPLPESPALVCDGGMVVQANLAAARLAGRWLPDSLIGLPLQRLLTGADTDAELARPEGHSVPVRVTRWIVPGTNLLMVFLVDVSDLRLTGEAPMTEPRFTQVQRAEAEPVVSLRPWQDNPAGAVTRWSRGRSDISSRPRDISSQPRDIFSETRDIFSETRSSFSETRSSFREPGDLFSEPRVDSDLAQERARLLEAQRIARIGSFTWEWGANNKLSYSPALAELFAGRCVDPADPLRHVHPEDLPALLRRVEEMVSDPGMGTLKVEFRGLPEYGETCYVCRLRAQRSDSGEILRLMGTVQDVTSERALERELREEQRRLAEAQRVARIGTWEWEPGSDRLVWSDMMQDLYGAAPASNQPTYQAYLSLVHPDDREWVDELWRQLLADHVPVECEHRVLRPDGTVRTFRCHGAVIADTSGTLRVVGTAQDVTDQRAAEIRMMRSSQRFADLVAVAPVGIGIFDDADRLIDANEALCKLLGYDLETLRGMSSEALTHPDDRAERLRTMRNHRAAPCESYTVPQRMLLRADGEPVYCELHISTSVQDDGQRFMLVVFTDVTERRRVAEALKHRATHDELTGLPNRAAIKEILTELLALPDRDLAVLFCDIDNFKRVNDALGHDAGDEMLVALARWLRDGLPEGCTGGRLSGDVFVVICSDVAAQGGISSLVATVSALLRTAIPLRGQLIRVSAAIGVAVPDAVTGNAATGGAEDLLRFADAAMFEAKRGGTGHFAMANAALMASADRQVELECQLREALVRDELQLYYQPVVDSDGAVLSAEALIRWPHPDHGMVGPDVFLPVAEQGNMMRELDRWVLRTALHEAQNWVTPDGRPIAVAVNLSALIPGEPGFVDAVATALAESGLPWDRLVLELVETALVDLPSAARQAMDELVERGVRFAVDDFGTGYSSLARLKELPAQIVKLDRRFVSGVGVDPADFAVARAVVDMVRAMGRTCVAEGVETATQFQVLRGLGVHAYQGWFFSRAVGASEFRALLGFSPLL
ncbi:MAG: EAL domain-containing protein [Actinomycetota bacterium]|nr:EAL domain-containing protein [Actinomycetota bacterium]